MSVKRLVVLLAAFVLTACGSATAPSLGHKVPERNRLLAAADAAAHNHGGSAKKVEAVKTTRGKAADLTGHSNLDQSEVVWVVQVSGDHYGCGACRIPAGASPPQGDSITMVLRASDFESTDGGLGPRATDLSALGDVQVLRDSRGEPLADRDTPVIDGPFRQLAPPVHLAAVGHVDDQDHSAANQSWTRTAWGIQVLLIVDLVEDSIDTAPGRPRASELALQLVSYSPR